MADLLAVLGVDLIIANGGGITWGLLGVIAKIREGSIIQGLGELDPRGIDDLLLRIGLP